MTPQILIGIVLCAVGIGLNITAVLEFRRSLRVLQRARRTFDAATFRYQDASRTYNEAAALVRDRRTP